MNDGNKEATKSNIIDLEEELEFYLSIGAELEKKCKDLDIHIKTMKTLAFKDTRRLAKISFSKLRNV